MDPELESSVEAQARLQRAREAAMAGFSAAARVPENEIPGYSPAQIESSEPPRDQVPYMLAAPAEQPAAPTVDPYANAYPPQQAARPVVPQQPAGRPVAPLAPAATGMVNLGQQPAPAQGMQPAGSMMAPISAETFANPSLPAAERNFQQAEAELQRRGVYTGIPTRSTQTITIPGQVDPETAMAAQEAGGDYRKGIIRQFLESEAGLGDQKRIFEEANVLSKLQAQQQQQEAEDQAREMRWQTQRADAINQQVLSGQIDPNRVLGDSFSAGRFAAAIGFLFAGLAQGQQGADAFLQNINRTIDRDIASQESRLESTRTAAQNQQNLVGMYRTVFGDQNAARESARATLLRSVAQRLQAQQARMAEAGQGPALQLVLAELDRAQAQAAIAAQQAQNVTTITRTQRSGGVSGGVRVPVVRAYTDLGEARARAGQAAVGGVIQGAETVGEMAQRQSAAPPEHVTRQVQDYAQRMGALNEAIVSRSRLEEALRRAEADPLVPDRPGIGVIGGRGPSFFSEGRATQAELQNLVTQYLSATTGAHRTPAEVAAAENLLIGTTEGDFDDRLRRFDEVLNRAQANIDAMHGPEVAQIYRQRFEQALPPSPVGNEVNRTQTPRR